MAHKVKKEDGEFLRASAPGFFDGARIRVGEKFFAPYGTEFTWAKPVGAAPEADEKGDSLLDKPVRDILPALPRLSDADLRALVDAEMSGRNRKSIVNAMNDELANRIGREGPQPDPLS